MSATLDPNDWVNTDEAFEDDYNPDDGISYAGFTMVPGDGVDYATLVFKADGVRFQGGNAGSYWAISVYYGYRYNGPDIPIHRDHARAILKNLAGTDDFESYEWAAQGWTYFE